MRTLYCQTCGVPFGIHPRVVPRVVINWRATGRGFFCPNGHALQFCKPDDPEAVQTLRDNATMLGRELAEAKAAAVDARQRAELLEAQLEARGER